MNHDPSYMTDSIKRAIKASSRPLSKPFARELGLTYKKLITCYRRMGLSIEAEIKTKKREVLDYCIKRMKEDSDITVRKLALELGRHEVGLAKLLRKNNVRDYKKKLSEEKEEEIKDFIIKSFGKKTAPKIAEELGITKKQSQVRHKKLGLFRKSSEAHMRSDKVNARFFEEWEKSPEVAYALGLLWADGCIHNRKRKDVISQKTLSISLIDYGMIVKLKNLLNSKYKLFTSYYKNKIICGVKVKKANPSHQLAISNRYLVETLEKIGMKQKKSLSACLPPYNESHTESVKRAFFRGYFDGDGCNFFTDKNKRYGLSILSNSTEQANCFLGLIPKNIKSSTSKVKSLFISNFSQKNSFMISHWMYKDSFLHLKRKFLKYKKACSFFGITPTTLSEGF